MQVLLKNVLKEFSSQSEKNNKIIEIMSGKHNGVVHHHKQVLELLRKYQK